MLYLLNLDTLLQGRDNIFLCQFVNRHDIVQNHILCKKIALFLFLIFQEDIQDFKEKTKENKREKKKVSSIFYQFFEVIKNRHFC